MGKYVLTCYRYMNDTLTSLIIVRMLSLAYQFSIEIDYNGRVTVTHKAEIVRFQ